MTKYMIAILAVSVSLFAVACGGAAEPAKAAETPAADTKAPEGAPAGDTKPADPAATPPAAPPAAAEAPKN